jgi:DNA invertase Pin-like site-specific DNA recombinase
MKVALYARVSTDLTEDDLRTADGEVVYRQNPEVQLIKLRAFVENHRWEKVAEYVDRASGKDASRPEFDKMMEAAFRHEFDIILIVRIDRIMRSLKNLHNVLENLKEYKVKLMATDQQLDMDTPNGRLMVNFLGMLAEWESDNTSVRVIDGMDRARCSRPSRHSFANLC